eukprot:5510561-Prymnesium_polylepis.1
MFPEVHSESMRVGCLEAGSFRSVQSFASVSIALVTHELVVDPSHLMAASHGHGPRHGHPTRHRLRVWPLVRRRHRR